MSRAGILGSSSCQNTPVQHGSKKTIIQLLPTFTDIKDIKLQETAYFTIDQNTNTKNQIKSLRCINCHTKKR